MLSEAKVRAAKPQAKGYRIADGDGLHIFVTPAGGKSWRYRYYIGGRERIMQLGHYPDMSIAEARAARNDAMAILKAGGDPVEARKADAAVAVARSAETFELLAREWHGLQRPKWVASHSTNVIESLEADIFPHIGNLPIRDITAPLILSALRKVEARGAVETARRIRQRVSEVFVFAIASGRAETDPAAILKKAMAPLSKGRMPAIVSLEEVREILSKVESTPSGAVTRLAHRLLALTAVRPGVIAGLPWTEFEGIEEKKDPLWVISAARMKLRLHYKTDEARDHLVPLSPQAIEVIAAVRPLTGRGPYVFPNDRHAHKPMSENAIGYLLNRAGYYQKHVPHGWRSAFSSIMNERHSADRHIIDLALAHTPKDKVEGAYNRALYITRRRELFQEWADLITDGLKPASDLLVGRRR
jgi:integrase